MLVVTFFVSISFKWSAHRSHITKKMHPTILQLLRGAFGSDALFVPAPCRRTSP